MAEKYIPFATYSNSTNQWYFTMPSTTLLPVYDPYWAVVKDSSDNYYLMPFANGTNYVCSNISTRPMSLLESSGFFDDSIDFTNGDSFYFKLDSLGTGRFSTDFRKPVVSTASAMQTLCSSTTTYTGNNTTTGRLIINKFEIQESAPSGGSCDITPLVPAILMIPATLIVLATFTIIYKMFMNRKVRG